MIGSAGRLECRSPASDGGLDLSEIKQIAADETSARRGRDYISLFVDMARRKVVYVADGKDAATVDAFVAFLDREARRQARQHHRRSIDMNLQNLDEEEQASIVRLEGQPGRHAALADPHEPAGRLHDAERGEREKVSPSLARLGQHCDIQPMKKVAATIMAMADESCGRSRAKLSNCLLEVQAAKRNAKGYRIKDNLKLMVYPLQADFSTLYPLGKAKSQ